MNMSSGAEVELEAMGQSSSQEYGWTLQILTCLATHTLTARIAFTTPPYSDRALATGLGWCSTRKLDDSVPF